MAIDKITSPVTWVTGTPVTPEWLGQIQKWINHLFDGSDTPRYMWIPAFACAYGATWTMSVDGGSLTATSASSRLFIPIWRWIIDGNEDYGKITEIRAYVKPAGVSVMTLTGYMTAVAGIIGDPPEVTTTPDILSTGTGLQGLSATGDFGVPNEFQFHWTRLLAGQTGDVFYGARVKIG